MGVGGGAQGESVIKSTFSLNCVIGEPNNLHAPWLVSFLQPFNSVKNTCVQYSVLKIKKKPKPEKKEKNQDRRESAQTAHHIITKVPQILSLHPYRQICIPFWSYSPNLTWKFEVLQDQHSPFASLNQTHLIFSYQRQTFFSDPLKNCI